MKKQPKVISLDYLLNLVKQQEAKDMIMKRETPLTSGNTDKIETIYFT